MLLLVSTVAVECRSPSQQLRITCAQFGRTKFNSKMCLEINSKFLDNVWENVRASLIQEVLSEDHKIIPVPNLSSASYFDSYSLFIKSKSESLGKKLSLMVSPTYKIIGHVSQVINLQKTDLNRLLNTSKPLDEETIQKEKWECHVELNNRSVHLTLEGIRKTAIPVIMEKGDLHLNTNIPELGSAKSVYIITDVLKASNITASVSDDNDQWERISLGSRPIAFGYAKFRLGHEGVVAEQVKTNPCPSGKWEVIMERLTGFLNTFDD